MLTRGIGCQLKSKSQKLEHLGFLTLQTEELANRGSKCVIGDLNFSILSKMFVHSPQKISKKDNFQEKSPT
jgi:hypothetical protein